MAHPPRDFVSDALGKPRARAAVKSVTVEPPTPAEALLEKLGSAADRVNEQITQIETWLSHHAPLRIDLNVPMPEPGPDLRLTWHPNQKRDHDAMGFFECIELAVVGTGTSHRFRHAPMHLRLAAIPWIAELLQRGIDQEKTTVDLTEKERFLQSLLDRIEAPPPVERSLFLPATRITPQDLQGLEAISLDPGIWYDLFRDAVAVYRLRMDDPARSPVSSPTFRVADLVVRADPALLVEEVKYGGSPHLLWREEPTPVGELLPPRDEPTLCAAPGETNLRAFPILANPQRNVFHVILRRPETAMGPLQLSWPDEVLIQVCPLWP